MRNATLRQLKVFETVARHASFSRAAEELHLTQPAISTQVKTLESHIGMPLFEQLGKKIFLTPAGAELLQHSREIIAHFRAAEEAMTHFKGASGSPLNVAAISAGDYFLPHLLVQFARRHEGVKLNLTVHNREELGKRLADNQTDLAIMGRPSTDMDTVNEPFAPHPYVIVAAPDHPLAAKKKIPLSALAEEPWLVREKGSDTRHTMEEAFGEGMQQLHIEMEIKSTETIKQAVMAGMGISFLSAHTLAQELANESLMLLDVQGFPVLQHWYVVYRRNKRLPKVAQAFREFLLNEGEAQLARINRPAVDGRITRSG